MVSNPQESESLELSGKQEYLAFLGFNNFAFVIIKEEAKEGIVLVKSSVQDGSGHSRLHLPYEDEAHAEEFADRPREYVESEEFIVTIPCKESFRLKPFRSKN